MDSQKVQSGLKLLAREIHPENAYVGVCFYTPVSFASNVFTRFVLVQKNNFDFKAMFIDFFQE